MNLIATHSTVRNQKTGGLLTFKTWASLAGIDTTDKAARKAAMKRYDDEKRDVLTDNRRILAAAATDARFDIKKFGVKTDKDGNVVGYAASARLHVEPKAQKAPAPTVDVEALAKAKAIEMVAQAMGTTPEEAEKYLARVK